MRKKIRTIKLLLLIIVIIGSGFGYYYSRYIAPDSYSIKKTTITNNSLPDEFKNFEIGFISDINLQKSSDVTRLKKIVTSLNKENVDMVIFGGDLFSATPFDNDKVIELLSNIKSKYGKFAVLGEKDLASSNDVNAILNEGGFEVLHNEYRPIYFNESTISLFGLEGTGELSGLINENNSESYNQIILTRLQIMKLLYNFPVIQWVVIFVFLLLADYLKKLTVILMLVVNTLNQKVNY